VQHSGLLSHVAAPGVGRHGGRGMLVAAMVGGCMVYLFLPRYIACHVSAVQKILSMQRPAFSYVGLSIIWYKKNFASCILPKETRSKKILLALTS
jgi:hypothetical protein